MSQSEDHTNWILGVVGRAADGFEKAATGGRVGPEREELLELIDEEQHVRADLLRERSKSLEEMAERAAFLVVENMAYDEKAATKHLKPAAEPILEDLHDRLVALEPWNAASIAPIFEAVREAQGGIGMGKLAQPVRVAVTGSSASPGIYETLEVLGKKKSVSRIAEAIHFIRHG